MRVGQRIMLPVTTHSETTRQQQQQQQCPARKYAAQGGERVGDSARLVVALLRDVSSRAGASRDVVAS